MITDYELERVARFMEKEAWTGIWDGKESPQQRQYFKRCARFKYGTCMILTRDVGHHTGGWFKNPDYERCVHLSMSPAPKSIITLDTPELDNKLTKRWLRAFFFKNVKLLWAESPKSKKGKQIGVWHYRLFCNENWIPIMPRGEVYSTELTERGWKSASELGLIIKTPEGEGLTV